MNARAFNRPLAASALLVLCSAALIGAPPALAQDKSDKNDKNSAPQAAVPVAKIPANATYLSSSVLRDRALGALLKRLGDNPMISSISISPDSITVLTQGKDAAYYTDQWTVTRAKVLILDTDMIDGPKPAYVANIVAEAEGGFFPFSDIDLSDLDRLITESTALAAMDGTTEVRSVTIDRAISILPEPAYGDVRWTISLATPRESATIYADASGQIVGSDLSGTTRAQRLNLIKQDDWPMAEAQLALMNVLGDTPVHEVRIYDSYVYVVADHPTDADLTRDYSWKLSGVTRGIIDTPNISAVFGDVSTFNFAELELSRLPELKAKAIEAYDSPGAFIDYISAEKPNDGAAVDPQVVWTIEFTQTDGEEGEVLLTADAEVLDVHLPESRRADLGPWIAPANVAATLARIGEEFGPDILLFEVMVNDTQSFLKVEDPKNPGEIAEFILGPDGVSRWGSNDMASMFTEFDPDRAFKPADLEVLTPDLLEQFADATLKRMDLEDAEVFRYTISRNMLMMEPDDDRLLIEVRAGINDGWTSGWVTFDVEGDEVDVMTP